MADLIDPEELRSKGYHIDDVQINQIQNTQILNAVTQRGLQKSRKDLNRIQTKVEPLPWFFEYLTAVKIEYILRDDLDISYQDLFKAYHKCLIDSKDCPITIYLVMIAIYDMGMEQDHASYKPFLKDFVNNQGKFLKCPFDKQNIIDYIEGFGVEFGPPKQSTSKAFGERDSVTLNQGWIKSWKIKKEL